jgi:hypothetical protein
MHHCRGRLDSTTGSVQFRDARIALNVGKARQRHGGENAEDDDDDDEFDHGEAVLPCFHCVLLLIGMRFACKRRLFSVYSIISAQIAWT